MKNIKIYLVALSALVLTLSCFAEGQARSWVSTNGDDKKPCSRQEPCKTFAGAITKTNAGGEIIALDSGGYGPITITKSITIDGAGVYAGINSTSTDNQTAISIDAHTDDIVVLRGLTLNGGQSPFYGISIVKAGSVFVEGCTISGFATGVLSLTDPVFIKDSIIRGNGTGVAPSGGTLEHCRIEKNQTGLIMVDGSSPVTISNSVLSGNESGVDVATSNTNTFLTIERCVITGIRPSGTIAGIAAGNSARIHVSETVVANYDVGLSHVGGGKIISFGNNRLVHNNTDGAFTSTKPQQ